jgi:serine/threonine protein kinase
MRNAIEAAARLDQEELLERIAWSREDDYIRRAYLKCRLNHTEGELQNFEGLKTYTISRDLGSGASGMVLQVNWLGQELALKILRVIDRTEATILDHVQHPNIVRLLHYWEEHAQNGPRSCIIMELMPRDLQKHIGNLLGKQLVAPLKRSHMPFSLPVAIDTMLQVAQAMRVLHENKLTHRDLKTSNILVKLVDEGYLELCREGYLEVKLADFGSGKAYVNSSQTRDLTRNTGTTVYGAPEIFEKEKVLRERNFPPKADVWSFGMTCSEILTGKIPFEDDAYRSTLHKRIAKNGLRPSLPEDCPDYLQFCIKSCWDLQPQRRPSFSDLCRMLRHAKLLSLGLMDVESSKYLFAYQTQAGVMKSGHGNSSVQQEELKVQKAPKKYSW